MSKLCRLFYLAISIRIKLIRLKYRQVSIQFQTKVDSILFDK